MRRLSGTYDGTQYVVLEYADGHVECAALLRQLLEADEPRIPTGDTLAGLLRELFGDTLRVEEGD